jgi:hypothetical protein
MMKFSPLLETADEDPYLNLTKELESIAGKSTLEQITIDIDVQTDQPYTKDPTSLTTSYPMTTGFPPFIALRLR